MENLKIIFRLFRSGAIDRVKSPIIIAAERDLSADNKPRARWVSLLSLPSFAKNQRTLGSITARWKPGVSFRAPCMMHGAWKLNTNYNHQNNMQDYLTQTEKLALCPVSPFVTIREDEQESETISTPPNGFRMPSMQAVRENDARLSLQSRPSFDMDDEQDDEQDDEENLISEVLHKRRDHLREFSFRLPSQSSRRECLAEMRSMGMAWGE